MREVVLGEKGVMNGLKKGGIFVDMTTREPSLASEIYSVGKSKGIATLDAPGNPTIQCVTCSVWRRYWRS